MRNSNHHNTKSVTGAPFHVLVVEDDVLILLMTTDLLEANGFRVTATGDGDQALAVLSEANDFDVLLTDMKLTSSSGHDIARQARKVNPRLKVIYLTGYSAAPDQQLFGPVLQKPVNPDLLVATVKEHVRHVA